MRRYDGFVVALCLTLFASGARAADAAGVPDTVDLVTVLRLVREASPRVAADREDIVQAEAQRITAGEYPNPSVSYSRSYPSAGAAGTQFTGTSEQETSVDFPVLFPGQYSARIAKAESDIAAARARVAAGESTLQGEVGSAYINLLAAQERVTLLGRLQDELLRLRDIIVGRQASGFASQYDTTRISVELATSNSKLAEAQADVVEASGALAGLVGVRGWRPKASGSLAPLVFTADIPSTATVDLANSSPAVVAATREEAAAQAAIVSARRERWPNVSVELGRAWTNNPFGATNYIGLTVEVPIFGTRYGEQVKAESEARAAMFRRELAAAETTASLNALASTIASRQVALQRFEQDAAGRLPALKEMAEDNYRLRGGPVLDLLDATRSRYDLEDTRIDLISKLMNAQVNFLAVTGKLEDGVAAGR